MPRIDPSRKNAHRVPGGLENASRVSSAEVEKKKWMEENRDAFAAYDALIDRFGVFGEEYRNF